MRMLQATLSVRLLGAGLLSMGVLTGCDGSRPMAGDDPAAPTQVRIAGIPFYPQNDYRCGPAAMAMVLDWTGLDITPAALERQFQSFADPRRSLAQVANRYGRLAYPIIGTPALMAELAAGHPVVVVQNLGVESRPLWNCTVAMGFDRSRNEVLVHTGDQEGRHMSLRLFERLWSDTERWGLVVLKPGELPAAAAQPDYVKAAYHLEQAGRYWEAVLAYDTALAKWPNDSDALMGLGSSLHSLGDARGAAEAYRAAAIAAGDPALAQAALAHIAHEQPHEEPTLAATRPIPRPQPRPEKTSHAIKETSN